MNGSITSGPRGAILHVNRQHIALNVKDGGNRPVYTLKPNGPNSTPIYAREFLWDGPTKGVYDGTRLSCGARAYMVIAPGTPIHAIDPMPYALAKADFEEGDCDTCPQH